MSAPPELDAPDTVAAGPTVALDRDARGPLRTAIRWFGMPVALGVVLLLTYLYISGSDLDAIETRQLTFTRLWEQTFRHVELTVYSTLWVLVLAIPLGIVATRSWARQIAPLIIGLGNAGQAIPSLGLLGLIFLLARTTDLLPSTGTVPAVTALVAYSFLPILRNTMIGLQQVDPAVLEAGRGMGMSSGRVLRRLELPLSVPVILAGVRTALVLNVGTAALVFLIGGGGLGRTIFQGFQLQRPPLLITGAVLVAVLALLIDHLAGLVEEYLSPKGL